jgi:hypothetical protein
MVAGLHLDTGVVDEQALAAEFEKEAQEAEANAAAHEKMAVSYKGLGTTGAYHADKHCAALASGYHTQAKQLKELAAAERAAAKHVKNNPPHKM